MNHANAGLPLQGGTRHNQTGPHVSLGTPPRKPAPLGVVRTPKVAAFAANRLQQQHHSPAAAGSRNASFASVAGEAAQPSLVVESQRFEEWMKIATDNVSSRSRPRSRSVGMGSP